MVDEKTAMKILVMNGQKDRTRTDGEKGRWTHGQSLSSISLFFEAVVQTAFPSHQRQISKLSGPLGEGFENILRKEENAGNQHFLLFPKCFQL